MRSRVRRYGWSRQRRGEPRVNCARYRAEGAPSQDVGVGRLPARWSRRSCCRSGRRWSRPCGIGPGMKVLDVAAGTGNASIPAAQAGADVTASDLTPELFEAGRKRAEAAGVTLDWVEADAENLPFEDASFDVVMSSIGAMFAPRHQAVADELVRVCRPGGTIGDAQLDSRRHDRRAVPHDGAVRAAAPARRVAAAAVGRRGARGRAVRRPRRARARSSARTWRSPPSRTPRDYGEHFKAYYGPTIVARANAVKDGREDEFDQALERLLRRVEPRHRRRRALRAGVPDRRSGTRA